jgi:tripartite-type tricarboxylate transporter receptor subunit TctC
MVVPAKTPPETLAVLRAATLTVLRNATTVKRMQDFGYVPIGNTPEEFNAYIKLEIERLGNIVRAFNLQPD